jgi:undecaprenyl-diphosphatase
VQTEPVITKPRSALDRLLSWDEKISARLALPEDSSIRKNVALLIGHTCDSWFWLAGLLAVWLFGPAEWRWRSFFIALVVAALAAAVLAIKYLIRRPRPEGDWGYIYRVADPHSFPSGHAARAAALALLLYPSLPAWAWPLLLGWALLVGFSRLAVKVHYFSDVLVGWLIGLLTGLAALSVEPWVSRLFPEVVRFLIH